MTLEKVFYVCMTGLNSFFEMLKGCVLSINGIVSISLFEVLIGSIVAGLIILFLSSFSWRS